MTDEAEIFMRGFKYGLQAGLETACLIHGCLFQYPNGPIKDRCVVCGNGRPEPTFGPHPFSLLDPVSGPKRTHKLGELSEE